MKKYGFVVGIILLLFTYLIHKPEEPKGFIHWDVVCEAVSAACEIRANGEEASEPITVKIPNKEIILHTIETPVVVRREIPTERSNTSPGVSDPAGLPSDSGRLTRSKGVHRGPSGKETWYNLPMGGVVRIMRSMGYDEETYPYRVREDGAKMLGNYIMIAANLELRPRGTIVETSLGAGIVCDTGEFCKSDQTAVDLAVDW